MLQVVFAIAGAIVLCLLYMGGRMVRAVIAWGKNEPGPKERIVFFLTIWAVVGAAVGWMAYGPYLAAQQCRAVGQPIITCAVFPTY